MDEHFYLNFKFKLTNLLTSAASRDLAGGWIFFWNNLRLHFKANSRVSHLRIRGKTPDEIITMAESVYFIYFLVFVHKCDCQKPRWGLYPQGLRPSRSGLPLTSTYLHDQTKCNSWHQHIFMARPNVFLDINIFAWPDQR